MAVAAAVGRLRTYAGSVLLQLLEGEVVDEVPDRGLRAARSGGVDEQDAERQRAQAHHDSHCPGSCDADGGIAGLAEDAEDAEDAEGAQRWPRLSAASTPGCQGTQ